MRRNELLRDLAPRNGFVIVFEYQFKSSAAEGNVVSSLIRISVDKPLLPPGMIMLEDAAVLWPRAVRRPGAPHSKTVGFAPGQRRFPDEVKRLTSIALSGIAEGSGIMECEVFAGGRVFRTRAPLVAAFDLVNAIHIFQESGHWPDYFPASIRNRIGAAVTPVLARGGGVLLSVQESGASAECALTQPVRDALQEGEDYTSEEPVEIVGIVYDINRETRQFKITTPAKKGSSKILRRRLWQNRW